MKGGVLGLRAKELSLMLIVLVCTTILIWAWDRTPLLTTFLPPKSQVLQLPPDIIVASPVTGSVSSKPKMHVNVDISSLAEKETADNKEEWRVGVGTPTSSAKSSNSLTALIMEETPQTVAEGAKRKHIQEEEKSDSAQSETTRREVEIERKVSLGEKNPEQERQSIDVVAPIGKASSVSGKYDRNLTMYVENQACNYAKGKWVVDNHRPLYSGYGCKQWLASMWACRLMQRKDFAYEKLRWQPKDCQMEEFEGSKFLRRMQDKTLAFVGDSLGRQQFQSMMCMITGGNESSDVLDVGKEFGLVTPKGSKRPNGWAYRFPGTNTTILYYWSAALCDLEPLDIKKPDTGYAMHLDRPPAFLGQFLHKFDVLVLNTGHHWNRGKLNANRWVMHIGGVPNTDKKLAPIGNAKNFTIHCMVSWVNSQLPKHPRLKAFYRSISPRHFFNGDWNTGGSCDNTSPMSVGKEVLQDESSDYSAASAVKGTGVKILDITALSQLRDEGHISRFSITASPGVQDCLHWCLPGVPDTWNEILFAQI